jgi:hypothetical protein
MSEMNRAVKSVLIRGIRSHEIVTVSNQTYFCKHKHVTCTKN